MKVGIMQPYFLPYIGYFQLIKAVDVFVLYDDVNFIKGGWINRNFILINGEKHLFTIKLSKASPNKLINEIEIKDTFEDFLKTIKINYRKAPHYEDVLTLIEKIITFKNHNLSVFIINSIKEILLYLDIHTTVLVSSGLQKNHLVKGKDKVIDICKNLGAKVYLNALGGKELYNKDDFLLHEIDLGFVKPEIIPYKQHSYNFVPCLSILDILMFNSVKETNSLLSKFQII